VRKEMTVGAIRFLGDDHLMAVEHEDCVGCVFANETTCLTATKLLGPCTNLLRSDGKGVIFKRVGTHESREKYGGG